MLPNKSFAHRTQPMHVYGPTGTMAMMTHLAEVYEADIRIRQADENVPPAAAVIVARDMGQGVVFERNGVKVTAFDVDHGDLIKPALGYRIDYGGHSVVLSGDTRPTENLIRFAKGCDVLFHEVAAARPELLQRSVAAQRIIGHHTTPNKQLGCSLASNPGLRSTHILYCSPPTPRIAAPVIAEVVDVTGQATGARSRWARI